MSSLTHLLYALRVVASCVVLVTLSGNVRAAAAPSINLPSGWVEQDVSTWHDPSGACVIRQQDFKQAFAPLKTQQQALSIGNKIRNALAKQGMSGITIQSITQETDWSVMAAYTYNQKGVRYQVAQLYLSTNGKLQTLTGSNAEGEASSCVNDMRNALKGNI